MNLKKDDKEKIIKHRINRAKNEVKVLFKEMKEFINEIGNLIGECK